MFTENLKAHEKRLLQESFPDGLGDLILSLLGLNDALKQESFELLNTHDRIKVPREYSDSLEVEDLRLLPNLLLNHSYKQLEGKWDQDPFGSDLSIRNVNEYSSKLEDAIDDIFPYNKDGSEITPITILIPNIAEERNDVLMGRSTNWDFYNLKYESEGDKQGFKELADQPETCFGLRLFLALKLLGVANIKQSKKNNPKLFLHLIDSTDLDKHFKRIDISKLKKYTSLHKELKEAENAMDKSSSKNNIQELVDRVNTISNEINDLTLVLDSGRRKAGFYYALERKPGCEPQKDVDDFIFPTINSKIKSKLQYQDNRIELDGFKASPRYLRRMRYALNYLIPMTGGTAITINVKSEKYKEIKGPTLILPKVWNEFALALKQHNPKNQTEEYDESMSDADFREQCKSAVYMDFWHKREQFMRLIPGISHTSDRDIDDEQRLKHQDKN
ncbi:MAG TPA: hypothetical protein VIM93_00190 [Kangiella sp.]